MLIKICAQSRRLMRSLLLGLAMSMAAPCLGLSTSAEARGEIGADVHAGVSTTAVGGNWRGGVSAWYRLRPPLAIGIRGETMASKEGEYDRDRIRALEAFMDAIIAPDSEVGGFARVSAGVADVHRFSVNVSSRRNAAAIFELEAGPELRLFQAPPDVGPRSAWFLRASGTLTLVPSETGMFGFALALGFGA